MQANPLFSRRAFSLRANGFTPHRGHKRSTADTSVNWIVKYVTFALQVLSNRNLASRQHRSTSTGRPYSLEATSLTPCKFAKMVQGSSPCSTYPNESLTQVAYDSVFEPQPNFKFVDSPNDHHCDLSANLGSLETYKQQTIFHSFASSE